MLDVQLTGEELHFESNTVQRRKVFQVFFFRFCFFFAIIENAKRRKQIDYLYPFSFIGPHNEGVFFLLLVPFSLNKAVSFRF